MSPRRAPGTMTDRPRIVITEDDEIVLDTADPTTYTILETAADLLAFLADGPAEVRTSRSSEQARITAIASGSVNTSGGRRRDRFTGAPKRWRRWLAGRSARA